MLQGATASKVWNNSSQIKGLASETGSA